VLLLDEPLANLDAKLREEMRFYIRHLQREFGITTVYVTHDQAEAMVLADRIVVLRDGVLQQVGSPVEIYQRPQTAWVADFIGLSNFIQGTVAGHHDGHLQIRTPMGTFTATGTEETGEVLIVLRPEVLHFTGPHPNRLTGIVRERAFLGNLFDYRIESGPHLLRVQADPSRLYQPGEQVELTFAPGDAWTVPDIGERS
jgi:ABC-type Fe3+/spermidine/putrescine transport system ATPase subunit